MFVLIACLVTGAVQDALDVAWTTRGGLVQLVAFVTAGILAGWDGTTPRTVAGMLAAVPTASWFAVRHPAFLLTLCLLTGLATFVFNYGLDLLPGWLRSGGRRAAHGLTLCLVAGGWGLIATAVLRRATLGEAGWGAGSREAGWQFTVGVCLASVLLIASRSVQRRRASTASAELATPVVAGSGEPPTVQLSSGAIVRLAGAAPGMTEPVLVAPLEVENEASYRGDARPHTSRWVPAATLARLEQREVKLWLFALFTLAWLAWPAIASIRQGLWLAL